MVSHYYESPTEVTMPSTDSHLCANCLQSLIYIKFAYHYCLVCDNAEGRCHLFRERQGYVPRDEGKSEVKPKGLPSVRVLRPDYQPFKTRLKENYHFARSLHIPSVVARDLRNKSKKEIEKVAKGLVTG